MSGGAAKRSDLRPGEIVVEDVWRGYRLVRERNQTLKETVLRRQRTQAEEFWAVRGVSFKVEPGTGLGIIGVNGSGKSTLLKLLAGVLGPSSGRIRTGGTMASLLDLGSGFSLEFTGRENVYLNAGLLGISRRETRRRMDEIIDFAELGHFIDQPVRTYSSGMLLRLAFSVAVTVEADILLLDEVLAVGDEAFQRKCLGRMHERRRSNATIVFVSHDMGAVEMICDHVLLLEHGRLVAEGKPSEVIGEYHEALSGVVTAPETKRGGAVSEVLSDGEGRADGLPTPRSWGTGRARITGLRLIGRDGVETTRLLSAAPAQVAVDYEVVDPTVPAMKFVVAVSQLDGDILFSLDSVKDGCVGDEPRPRGTAILRIPSLPLLQGRFLLSAGIGTSTDSEVMHRLDHWTDFSVFQSRGTGGGIIPVKRSWEISGANGRRAHAVQRVVEPQR